MEKEVGSHHERLRRGTGDGQVPPTFMRDVSRAVYMGRGFRFEHGFGAQDRKFADLPRRYRQSLVNLARGSQAARKAIYAGFYHGLLTRRSDERVSSLARAAWGAIAQHELTKAMLWLPDERRRKLHDDAELLRIPIGDWRRGCVGAMAVARVAYTLLEFTSYVYLPQVEEDTIGKIDLIAYFPSIGYGLCIQVKGASLSPTTAHQIVAEPWLQRRDSGRFRSFLDGLDGFSEKNAGDWAAAQIDVGMAAHPFEALEVCPTIQRGVIEMLIRSVPGFAAAVRRQYA